MSPNDSAGAKTMANAIHKDAVNAGSRLEFCPIMSTYGAPTLTMVKGEGTELWDNEGRRYLDFLCGLAVTSLGHSHPVVAEAIAEQAVVDRDCRHGVPSGTGRRRPRGLAGLGPLGPIADSWLSDSDGRL